MYLRAKVREPMYLTCVCVCLCMHACVYACMRACACMRVLVHVCVCRCMCRVLNVRAHACVRMHVCIWPVIERYTVSRAQYWVFSLGTAQTNRSPARCCLIEFPPRDTDAKSVTMDRAIQLNEA